MPDELIDPFLMSTTSMPVPPEVQTMAATGGIAPALATPPVVSPMLDKAWKMAPPQQLLQRLIAMQAQNPDRFAQMMGRPGISRFGITPENLATMQSRQDLRAQAMAPFKAMGRPMAPAAPAMAAPAQQNIAPGLAPPPVAVAQQPQHGWTGPGWGGRMARL